MKRFEWIDTLKGIGGIVLVVASHIYRGVIREFLGIFSMPLFFFIGGFLYSPHYSYPEYLKKKLVHLIVPYIGFILLLYPWQLLLMLPKDYEFSSLSFLKLIVNPIIGGAFLWGLTSAFWFITCFFITQQFANFLIKKFPPFQLAIYSLLMVTLAYINAVFFPRFFLPQNAHVALMATPIFLLGVLFRREHSKISYWWISLPSLIIALFAVILRNQNLADSYQVSSLAFDMKRNSYGIPVISLILAIGLILFWIDLSKFIVKYLPFLSKVFSPIGQASLVILCLHLAFIYGFQGLKLGLSSFSLFIISTFLSFVGYLFFLKSTYTRAIFLGSYTDFAKIFSNSKKQTS